MNTGRRARVYTLFSCLVLAFAPSSHAQPESPAARAPAAATQPAPADPSECSRLRSGALAQISCALSHGLHETPSGVLVVAAPIASDGRIEKPRALAVRVAELLAGALGRGARHASEPSSLGSARTLAAGASGLVFVRTEIARGQFRALADLYEVRERFWQRVRDPAPAPRAHAFASSRLDAELRTFLSPVPLVARSIEKARTSGDDLIAIACDDTDLDGALEIVWAGRRHVGVGRIRQGQLIPLAARPWLELSPVAGNPLREPLGGIAVHAGRFMDVGSTDRADGVRFDATLSPITKLGRNIPWPTSGCAALGDVALQGTIAACVKGDPIEAPLTFPGALDALAAARIVDRSGRLHEYRAARSSQTGELLVRHDGGRHITLPGCGAQAALGDLDLDGQPEIVTTADSLEPLSDAVSVRTWQENGQIVERWRVRVPNGVQALAVCPPEGDGPRSVVVATRAALWIIR